MSSSKALRALLVHLQHDRDVPLTWAVEHGGGGDLGAHWRACDDAAVMFGLASPVDALRSEVLRAAAACVRLVAHRIPPAIALQLVIDAAASWDPAAAPNEDVEQVARTVYEQASEVFTALPSVPDSDDASASRAAVRAARTLADNLFLLASGRERVPRFDGLAAAVLESRFWASRQGEASVEPVQLADLVREHVRCPTFEQMREAFQY